LRPEPRPHLCVVRRAYKAVSANVEMPPGGWPRGTLALLVNGGDAIRGELSWTGGRLEVEWQGGPADQEGDGAPAAEVAAALGGRVLGDPASGRLLCLHPLGGCAMGRSSADGVVDSYGQVFDCPGLYVADGAVVPGPIGEAPALTIAALADRTAAAILEARPLS
jgi:cholesterol oxidase